MSAVSLRSETRGMEPALARPVIVGGAGEVGRLVGRVLGPEATRLETVDPRAAAADGSPELVCARVDVMDWARRDESLLEEADCVVLAVPEELALRALEPLAERMPEGALLVDTLSVKGPVVSRMRRLSRPLELLSLNPMFAPALDLRGQAILAVEVAPGARSRRFLGLFRRAGGRVFTCGPEEHDRTTGVLQALTHTAILSFGAALADHGDELDELLALAPPPFLALAALLARIVAGRATTYHDIQASNPHARSGRESLAGGRWALEAALEAGPAGFSELLADLRQMLGTSAAALEREAQRMLEGLRAEDGVAARTSNGSGALRIGAGSALVGDVPKGRDEPPEEGV